MSIFKREGSPYWHIFLQISGKTVRRSAKTTDRKKALAFEQQVRDELYRIAQLGQPERRDWDEAALRYIQEKEEAAQPSVADDKHWLRWISPHLTGMMLDEIDADTVERLIQKKQADRVKARTVNSVTKLVRAVLRKAKFQWGWLPKHELPPFRMLREPKRRVRFLSQDEAERLLAELPNHLRAMAIFTLETGLRMGNVTALRWNEVDLAKRMCWVHVDEIKNRNTSLAVPLSNSAVITLREQLGKHNEYVFTFEGRPVLRVNTHAWRKALRRAGIDNFRWHDLRHTWASWHIQDGTPLPVLQELGGWEDINMVRRYTHLSNDYLAQYVNRRGSRPRLVASNASDSLHKNYTVNSRGRKKRG